MAAELLTVKSVPLFEPVTTGLFETTRILYPVPAAVPAGIVAEIISVFEVLVTAPIETGEAKLPAAFDNCAVYTLPPLKVPTLVKGTETVAPVEDVTQKGLPTKAVFVVMVFEE